MNVKRWSIPVERTYEAPEGTGGAPRAIRSDRRVDLVERDGRFHVYVDGRMVVHKEHEGELTFGIGRFGCVISRTVDDWELSVGGKRIGDFPSVFPVALHTNPPPPPEAEAAPIRLHVSPRLIALVATLFAIVAAVQLLSSRSSSAPAPEWHEVRSSSGRYGAELPGTPDEKSGTHTSGAMTLTLHEQSARVADRGAFGVLWADLPTNADGTLPIRDDELVTMCTLATNAFLAGATGFVASPADLQVADKSAVREPSAVGCQVAGTAERAWRFADLLSSTALHPRRLRVEVRGTVIGARLYVRAVVVESDGASGADARRFFNGVKIDPAG
ncbi:MAG: hypothetical protein HYV09_18335 [Deltaproteobacteria bacterium]|nr:hypothetical protein [Deltaproteobacteria bacterium]